MATSRRTLLVALVLGGVACLDEQLGERLECEEGSCGGAGGGGGTGGTASGGSGGTAPQDPCAPDAPDILLGCDGQVVIRGDNDNLGSALAVADLDEDGNLDLVAGGPSGNASTGLVWIFYGPLAAGSYSLPRTSFAAVRIAGEVPGERFGGSLAVGSFGGGPALDLAVGTGFGDPELPARHGYLFLDVGRPACGADCTTALASARYSAGSAPLLVAAAHLLGDHEQLLFASTAASAAVPERLGSVFVVDGTATLPAAGDPPLALQTEHLLWIQGGAGAHLGQALAAAPTPGAPDRLAVSVDGHDGGVFLIEPSRDAWDAGELQAGALPPLLPAVAGDYVGARLARVNLEGHELLLLHRGFEGERIQAFELGPGGGDRGGIATTPDAGDLGTAMAHVGEFLGAGTEAVGIGAPKEDHGGEGDRGAVYLLTFDELRRNLPAGASGRRIVGAGANAKAGAGLAAGALIEAGSGRDLAVGAQGNEDETGTVYVLPGR